MPIIYNPYLSIFFFVSFKTLSPPILLLMYQQLIPLLLLSFSPFQALFIFIHLVFFKLPMLILNFLFDFFIEILRILLFIQQFLFLFVSIHLHQAPLSILPNHSFVIVNDLMSLKYFLLNDFAFLF